MVYDTTVDANGRLFVKSNGIATDNTVKSGGELHFSSGCKLTGQTVFDEGAIVFAYNGAILDFDISELAPGNTTARVNDLSIMKGDHPVYTLTVSDSQGNGVYSLADGAAGFDSTLAVMNTAGWIL